MEKEKAFVITLPGHDFKLILSDLNMNEETGCIDLNYSTEGKVTLTESEIEAQLEVEINNILREYIEKYTSETVGQHD